MLDIKKIRESKNLTQEEMANLLGVSRKTIANYEAGGNIPETKEKIFTKILSNYTLEEEVLNKVSEPNESYPGNIHKLAYESILFFDELMTVEQYKNFFNNKLDLELDKFKDLEALKKYINR